MKLNNNQLSSLLRYITPGQVDDLIYEEQLKEKGYRFSYVVDTYDLQNYCFPLGLNPKREEVDEFRKRLTFQDKLDEHITYDLLLQEKDNYFFLLDQYTDELYDLNSAIRNLKTTGVEIVDTQQELLNKFSEGSRQSIEINDVQSVIEKDISLIISLAIGYLRSGFQKIEKLISDHKLILDSSDEYRNERVAKIASEIADIRPLEISESLYGECKKVVEKLKYKNIVAKYNRLVKYKNDTDVIDRVISCNKELYKDKELVVFVSSTSNNTKWFQAGVTRELRKESQEDLLIRTLNTKIKNALPTIEEIPFNPHRTSSQLFLSSILNGETSPDKKMEFLEKFKNSIAIEFDEQFKNINQPLDREWSRRLVVFRERAENYGMLVNLTKFKTTLEKAIKNERLSTLNKLKSEIIELLDLEKQSKEIKSLRNDNFRLYIYENNFFNSLKRGFDNLTQSIYKSSDKSDFYKEHHTETIFSLIKSGQDRIFGKYQILPIVFFVKDKKIAHLIEVYTNFLLDDHRTFGYYEANNFYKNWLTDTLKYILNRRDNDSGESNELKLLRCLILLFLPGVRNQEKIVIGRIKEIINFDLKEEDQYLKKEFYYIGAWAARRSRGYKVSELFCQEGLKIDKEDPRFYHGKSLVSYCMGVDEDGPNAIKSLKKSVKNAQDAIRLYEALETQTKPIKKSLNAVYNTIIYSYCLIWDKNNQPKDEGTTLQSARNLLKILKSKDELYEKTLEFLHTEAYLEYLEAIFEKKNEKLESAADKIMFARAAIRKALNINNENQECIELKRLIDDLYIEVGPHIPPMSEP